MPKSGGTRGKRQVNSMHAALPTPSVSSDDPAVFDASLTDELVLAADPKPTCTAWSAMRTCRDRASASL